MYKQGKQMTGMNEAISDLLIIFVPSPTDVAKHSINSKNSSRF